MTFGPRPFPDRFLSIYQSAAEEYERLVNGVVTEATKSLAASSMIAEATKVCIESMEGGLGGQPDQVRSVSDSLASCAYLGFRYLEALVKGDVQSKEAIKQQMRTGQCDPKWLTTLEEYYQYFGLDGSHGKVPYRPAGTVGRDVIPIKSNARVAIVGDWGTGAAPAYRIAKHIGQLRPDVVIHLGDIYYSGTSQECQDKFLNILDVELGRKRSRIPIFTLAGNHDMYSGGSGYYNLIDRINDEAFKQKASFFCLRSEDNAWQFLALDTGYHDISPVAVDDVVTFLEPDEEQWHSERIAEFPGKTILLSHHQPFSAFARIGAKDRLGQICPYNPKLMDSFRRFQNQKIAVWFWGHEHSLSIYQPYMGLNRGRCLGHGAIPVLEIEHPYDKLENVVSPPELVADHPVSPTEGLFANGFALVELEATTKDSAVSYYSNIRGVGRLIAKESLATSPPPIEIQWMSEASEFQTGDFETLTFAPESRLGRIAFVVGNAQYSNVPRLRNADDDARAVQSHLASMGFSVYGGVNLTTEAIRQLFDQFQGKILAGDTVLFYYSGHGVQVNGQNVIIPVDATLSLIEEGSESIRLQRLVDRILASKAGRCLVFLDACRDNPFTGESAGAAQQGYSVGGLVTLQASARVLSQGLAPLEVARDTQVFIGFAAEPGKFAYEGKGEYSRFTTSFLRHIDTEGLNLDGLMRRVGADVKTATQNRQRPWSQSNLTEDFSFKPASWEPVYTMALLGLVAGLLTSNFVFDPVTARFKENYLAGLFFAAVAGYGVWRWGPRTIWSAALATMSTALAWAAGMGVLHYVGTFDTLNLSSICDEYGISFKNWKLTRDIVGAAIAGGVFITGSVVGGAITTPSLRRPQVIAMALLSGVAVALIEFLVSKVGVISSSPCNIVTTRDFIINFAGGTLWVCFLAAALGYGLSQYIRDADEIDSDKNQL